MVFFFAEGRLGNQIFQYLFLKKISNNSRLYVTGFEELREVFGTEECVIISRKYSIVRLILDKFLKPFLSFLGKNKIITTVSVEYESVIDSYKRESASHVRVDGFFRFIVLVNLGFFQSHCHFRKTDADKLKIKPIYQNKADALLSGIPNEFYKIFVHVRRGDYKAYKVYGKSALLPLEFYTSMVTRISKKIPNAYFIFMSDDPDYIAEQFGFVENKMISRGNHYGVDLAIMTECNAAILSPSSFGWWGAYLMKNRDLVYAPKYWLGFNSSKEYHGSPVPDFFTEILIK